jgi:hypothetical protein
MVAFGMVVVIFEFFHRWSSVLAAKRGSFFFAVEPMLCLFVSEQRNGPSKYSRDARNDAA